MVAVSAFCAPLSCMDSSVLCRIVGNRPPIADSVKRVVLKTHFNFLNQGVIYV